MYFDPCDYLFHCSTANSVKVVHISLIQCGTQSVSSIVIVCVCVHVFICVIWTFAGVYAVEAAMTFIFLLLLTSYMGLLLLHSFLCFEHCDYLFYCFSAYSVVSIQFLKPFWNMVSACMCVCACVCVCACEFLFSSLKL